MKTINESSPAVNQSCTECGYALFPNCGECTNCECRLQRKREARAFPVGEFIKRYTAPALWHGRKWGDWTLDTERLCLVYRAFPVEMGDGTGRSAGVPKYTAFHGPYEVDLERMRDSAAILDWIFQVNEKLWADARVTKDLINALDDVMHPQKYFCSGACGSGSGGKTIKNLSEFLRGRIAESEREAAAVAA